jgi:hypothetical protein
MKTTNNNPRNDAPELALRLRRSASILTRAACMVASRQPVASWTDLKGRVHPMDADQFTMSGLIRMARRDLFPEVKTKKRQDGRPTEGAMHFAFGLIAQDPIDTTPSISSLVAAAKQLREWAEFQDAVERWAA